MSEVKFDKTKTYSIQQAAELMPKLSTSKFVGSVDIDIVLTVAEKHKKTNAAGSISLPHQAGASKKVIVFTSEDNVKAVKAAGAVDAGLDTLAKKVEDGEIEFDVVLASPDVMAKIARLGKVLGPKGLMPNPNNGTIAADVVSAVGEFMAGKQSFKKSDQQAIRGRVAKVNQTPTEIAENVTAYLKAVYAEVKKFGSQPFKRITLAPTMGAGVRLDLTDVMEQIA